MVGSWCFWHCQCMPAHFIFISKKVPSIANVWPFTHPRVPPALLLGRLALDGLLLACLLLMALLLLGGDLHSVTCRLEGLSRCPCALASCCAGEHRPMFIPLAASHGVLLSGLPRMTPTGGAASGTCVPCIMAMGVAVPPIIIPFNWVAAWDVLRLLVLLVPALVALLLRALVAIDFSASLIGLCHIWSVPWPSCCCCGAPSDICGS